MRSGCGNKPRSSRVSKTPSGCHPDPALAGEGPFGFAQGRPALLSKRTARAGSSGLNKTSALGMTREKVVPRPSKGFRWASLLILVWFALTPVPAAAPQSPDQSRQGGIAATLETTLAGMDRAAARFSTVAGNLEYTKVTVIVNDHSTERGTISFEKAKGKTRVMLAFKEPAEKFVLFEGNKVSLYRPRIAEVEEYNIGQRQGLVEQFLLLGFGTPGSELQKAYQIV